MNTHTLDSQTSIPLMEAFYTVQGEGCFQGHAAYFIRLAGCDVGCVWCDVKDSWEMNAHPLVPIERIVAEAAQYPARIAVITGGEPLMHNLDLLCQKLKALDFKVHIETAGVHPLSGELDWICFSPKKFKKPTEEIYQKADELKVVIYHKSDFEWAENHALKVKKDCKLLLQPEWDKRDEMMPLIVEYVKTHPQWKISLQTHKYLNIP